MPEHQQIQQSKKPDSTFQKQATPVNQTPVSNPYSIIQRAKINPRSLTRADIMQLQRTIGNQAVGKLLSSIGSSSTAQQATVQRQEIPEEEEPLQGKMAETVQRQEIPEEEEPLQGKFESIQRQEIPEEEPLQTKKENNTGMPDNLKAGVESLSGIDMSNVKVHYNSSKPAEVGALAYTQGTDIHVAPGQEKHLPHEAWHVVQQKQGRVKPILHAKGLPINDDEELETEADIMGVKATLSSVVQHNSDPLQRSSHQLSKATTETPFIIQMGREKWEKKELTIQQQTILSMPPDLFISDEFIENHISKKIDAMEKAKERDLDVSTTFEMKPSEFGKEVRDKNLQKNKLKTQTDYFSENAYPFISVKKIHNDFEIKSAGTARLIYKVEFFDELFLSELSKPERDPLKFDKTVKLDKKDSVKYDKNTSWKFYRAHHLESFEPITIEEEIDSDQEDEDEYEDEYEGEDEDEYEGEDD